MAEKGTFLNWVDTKKAAVSKHGGPRENTLLAQAYC